MEMLRLNEYVKQKLSQRQKYHFGNVPGLPQYVLIIFDYSPSDNEPPLSIAFDGELGPKCWMTENKFKEIGNSQPLNLGAYEDFYYEERKFYSYSVTSYPQSDFNDVNLIEKNCWQLYQHIVWSET